MSTQEIYETMSQYSVPFFSHISYVPKPALSSLDINEISDTLVTNFQGNTLFHSYGKELIKPMVLRRQFYIRLPSNSCKRNIIIINYNLP